jgi:hypothetical protein
MDVPTEPHKTLQQTPSLLIQSSQIPGKRVHVCQNRFVALIFYVKYRIMTKFCGYLVGDDWLFQRGVELGIKPPETRRDEIDIMLEASRDARLRTGVYGCTKLRRVVTLQGKRFWCIAFACTEPHEGLPTSRPPEETYKLLKELLGKQGPPLWFRAS